jgi:hypothetical protein
MDLDGGLDQMLTLEWLTRRVLSDAGCARRFVQRKPVWWDVGVRRNVSLFNQK